MDEPGITGSAQLNHSRIRELDVQAFIKAVIDRCHEIMDAHGERVFFGHADPDTEMPYLVITSLDPMELERQSDGDVIENRPCMFTVYDENPDTATDILKLIENSFEGMLLVLSEGKCLGAYQVSSNVTDDSDRDDDGKEVFQGISLFDFHVQRSLVS